MAKGSTEDAVADAVVREARGAADEVLARARASADATLAQTSSVVAPAAALSVERAAEDSVLRRERAAADARVREARAEAARTLRRLLPLERDSTDRDLVTERAHADDAIAHRDDFLGIVSHDLRNLLAGIVTSADLLAARAGDADAPLAADATRIHRYAARMNRLIGDLLDVASIDAGRLAVAPVAGDPGPVLAEALGLFAAAAVAKGIDLDLASSGEASEVRFDHDRLLQVMANLIGNALKFTPSGGRVRVVREPTAGGIRVSVIDTGAGIPEELLEAVFERFWQAEAGDRRGLGLGLYISRCIVEAHGGTLRAERVPGGGSALRFTLLA